MKVKVVGQHTVFHFAAAVVRLFEVLHRNGIDEIRHGNIYFHLYSKGLPVEYLDEDGSILKTVEIDSALKQSDEELDQLFRKRVR